MSPIDKTPSTRKSLSKLAVIGVLLVTLIVLLWHSSHGASNAGSETDPSGRVARRKRGKANPRPAWPEFDVADLIAWNPFERTAEINLLFGSPTSSISAQPRKAGEGPEASTSDDARPHRMELNCRLDAVYRTAQGAVAMIDARIVRVGDLLEGNLRVVEIAPQSVIVETVDSGDGP